MKRFLLGLAAALLLCQTAHALPKPSRIIEVAVAGNTYGAYSPVVTLTATERYAKVKLRPGGALTGRLAWVDRPNTYTANYAYSSLEAGEVKELWNYKLFAAPFPWYGNTTNTAGTITFEIETFSNTIP